MDMCVSCCQVGNAYSWFADRIDEKNAQKQKQKQTE